MRSFLILLLFALPALGASFTVSSSTASSSFTNPTLSRATNESVFTYYGFPTTNYSGDVYSIGISSAAELAKFPPVQVFFSVTGTNFEMLINSIGGGSVAYYTLSDGFTATHYTNSSFTGGGTQPSYTIVTFATNTTHQLSLSIKGGFRGINTTNGNSVSSYSLDPRPNLLIMEGDSYTEGYNPSVLVFGHQSLWFDGWVWQLAGLVPNTISVPSAISGTGFVNTGGGSNYGARVVADICVLYTNAISSGKYSRLFIAASGTINDLSFASNSIYTNAVDVYTAMKNKCPQASVFAVGNWLGAGGRTSPQADDIAGDRALSNAAQVVSIPYYSAISANLRNTSTYNTFFPPGNTDSVHPCAAGYAIMAQWVNTNLASTFGSNWSAGGLTPPEPVPALTIQTLIIAP